MLKNIIITKLWSTSPYAGGENRLVTNSNCFVTLPFFIRVGANSLRGTTLNSTKTVSVAFLTAACTLSTASVGTKASKRKVASVFTKPCLFLAFSISKLYLSDKIYILSRFFESFKISSSKTDSSLLTIPICSERLLHFSCGEKSPFNVQRLKPAIDKNCETASSSFL